MPLFLRNGDHHLATIWPAYSDSGAADLTVALDQNRFLEEHNAHLQSTLTETKQKLQALQETHGKVADEFKTTQKLLKDIQTENELYRSENNRLTSEFDRKLQVVNSLSLSSLSCSYYAAACITKYGDGMCYDLLQFDLEVQVM